MNTIQWEAVYQDGTKLRQYEGDARRAYEDIDRVKLASFSLYKDAYATKLLTIHLEPGQRLIYRKRVQQRPGHEPVEVYFAGWWTEIHGERVQSIAYVCPDGRIEMAGAWKNDQPWFYEPQYLPQELPSQ